MERIMGFAAGSGSESRDKLAGAVAAPHGLFLRAGGSAAGWAHPQAKPETGGPGDKWNHPIFDFPAQAYGVF